MESFTVDPIRKFESKGVVSTLQCQPGRVVVGAGSVLVTAVTGQRIRVMGLYASPIAAAAVPGLVFRSNAGGTIIHRFTMLGSGVLLPITDSGYFETATGQGLVLDLITADIDINVFYITYTPS